MEKSLSTSIFTSIEFYDYQFPQIHQSSIIIKNIEEFFEINFGLSIEENFWPSF